MAWRFKAKEATATTWSARVIGSSQECEVMPLVGCHVEVSLSSTDWGCWEKTRRASKGVAIFIPEWTLARGSTARILECNDPTAHIRQEKVCRKIFIRQRPKGLATWRDTTGNQALCWTFYELPHVVRRYNCLRNRFGDLDQPLTVLSTSVYP